jgi:hypothetical protein
MAPPPYTGKKPDLKPAFDEAGKKARDEDPGWNEEKWYDAAISVQVKGNPGIKEYKVDLTPKG